MSSRRLHCQGLVHADQTLLRSMLGLLAGHTREPWTYVEGEGESIDLNVVSVAVASGWHGDRPVVSARSKVRAVVGPRLREDDLTLERPFRIRALISLLDTASMRLEGVSVAVPPTSAPTFVDLLYGLRTEGHGREELAYCVPEGDLIRIHPRRWTYSADDGQRVLAAADRRDVSLRPWVRDPDRPEAGEQDLTPLLWTLGLAYQDTPVAPVQLADPIRVQRWPDLGRLPHRSEHIRMVAHLVRHPVSIRDTVAALGVEPADAIGLANALLLGGFAAPDGPESGPPTRSPARPRSGLFQRIRARLGLGG